jgi:GNAT superfamily N-acetyltransferase
VPDVRIRPARDEDARSIAEIHVRAWHWAYRDLLPPAVLDRLSVDRRAAYWQQWLADAAPRRQLWLAVEQDRPVGFVAAGPSRDPDAEAATGEVHALYLEREVVGTGVGRALCARAVDRLRHDGFREATLWVMTANGRARRFYERAGWRPDGAEKTEEWAGARVPEVRYRRPLIPEASGRGPTAR